MLVWYCFRQTRNWVRHVSLHRPLAAPTEPEPDDVLNPRQQWPLASRPNSFWKRSIRSSNTPDALTDTTMTTSSSSTTTTIDDEDIFVCLYGLLLLLQIYFSSVLNSINTLVTHTNTQKHTISLLSAQILKLSIEIIHRFGVSQCSQIEERGCGKKPNCSSKKQTRDEKKIVNKKV